MLGVVAAAGDAIPRRLRSEFDCGARRVGATADRQLPEIEKLEREVTLATASAYDLHFRLLPHLREIAQARARTRRARAGPGHARPLVGAAPPRPAGARGPVRARESRRPNCAPSSATLRGCDRDDRPRRGRPALEPRPRRGREGRRRQARRARAAAARAARRRSRPDRGLPGPREDADGAVVRAGDVARLLAHPVHARPDAVRRDRLVGLQPARSRTSSSGPARSSRTSCSPTRSTAPRRRRRRRCSRRCRSGR